MSMITDGQSERSEDDVSKGSDTFREKPRRTRKREQNSKNHVPAILHPIIGISICILTAALCVLLLIVIRSGFLQETHYVKSDDLQNEVTEMKQTLREIHSVCSTKTMTDRMRPLFKNCRTDSKLRWMPRKILTDINKLEIIRSLLKKEQRKLFHEYAKLRKQKISFFRNTVHNASTTDDYTESLICASPTQQFYQYGCVYGNRSLEAAETDYIDINMKFRLVHKNHVFEETLLFEFGLVSEKNYTRYSHIPVIKGYRCAHKLGICLEVFGKQSIGLIYNTTETNYVETRFTIKLHEWNVIFMTNEKIRSIHTVNNTLNQLKLYPAFVVYNPHLAHIIISIASEIDIGYDITSIDSHMFISNDNKSLSNLPFVENEQQPYQTVYNSIKYTQVLMISICVILLGLSVESFKSDEKLKEKHIYEIIIVFECLVMFCAVFVSGAYMYIYLPSYVSLSFFVIYFAVNYFICRRSNNSFDFIVLAMIIPAISMPLVALVNIFYNYIASQ